MFVVSNLIGSTIQITTLPLPVLSTLQASGLVFNTAFATLLLKEPFTRFSLIGTILTCVGAALIAVFGAIGESAHSLEQLLELLKRKPFVVWMVGTMVVAVITVVFAHVLKIYSSHKHLTRHLHKNERPRSSSKSDTSARRVSITAQLPRPLQLKVGRLRLIRGLSYALISGILSAHSLLMAKSAVELIVRTIVDHNNQFNRFQSWLILLALLFFALSQLYYLHLGLRICSTSVLYPFVFCIYNIIAILDGLIYFHQTSRLTALHGGLIAVGTVILLSGVLALSWRLDDTTPMEPPPQAMPQTPLTPGMGLMRTSEDNERSPLLPTSVAGGIANDERTPLLSGHRSRRSTIARIQHAPTVGARDIWAELDDDDKGEDFLASLPRSPSLLMGKDLDIAKRRRGGSLSTHLSSSERNSRSQSPNDTSKIRYPRRSQTLQAHRRLSGDLPTVKNSGDEENRSDAESIDIQKAKDLWKSPSRVRFRESDHQGPSRYNAAAANSSPARSPRRKEHKAHDDSKE